MAGSRVAFKFPMTLIEGHARVLLQVGDSGVIERALFQGMDSRFFESFLVGQLAGEVPRITPMICGVCSATHHVASAKAVDEALAAPTGPEAWAVRDMINLGIHLNNQAMHLLALGLPDFLPEDYPRRSMLGLAKERPRLVETGVKLMELGFEAVSVFGGRDVHPVNAIPGGVASPPDPVALERFRGKLEKGLEGLKVFVREALDLLESSSEHIEHYKPGYTHMLALRGDGAYDPTHGRVVLAGPGGEREEFPDHGRDYLEHLEEYTVEYSYIRMVRPRRGGAINTGALARMNLLGGYGIPEADEVVDRAKSAFPGRTRLPLVSHYARIAEVVATYTLLLEGSKRDFSKVGAVEPGREGGVGVGIIEAPRGTLIHHFDVKDGRVAAANIITPTAINAAAMEADLTLHFRGEDPARIEPGKAYYDAAAIVRAYDPCMACATHTATERACIELRIVDGEYRTIRVVPHE